MQIPSASAALIAGSDFSDAAVFNAPGGNYDNSPTSTDDLNPLDNITVSDWSGVAFVGFDANAQLGMPNDNVTKINGDAQSQPMVGDSPAGFASVSFSIDIPAGTTLNLSSVTWDWRKATGSGNVRWLAFNTSLDSVLTFSELGEARDAVQNGNVDLTGAAYQGLTDTTVTFNWYAGGEGSGDIDFDTAIVNGTVIPEPSGFALFGLGALGLVLRRRR